MTSRLAVLIALLLIAVGGYVYYQFAPRSPAEPLLTGTPHLEPCSTALTESPLGVEYLIRVRRMLDPDRSIRRIDHAVDELVESPDGAQPRALVAQLVCTPGWQAPEWAVTVLLPEEGPATIELAEAESSIWIANSGGEGGLLLKRDAVTVPVHRSAKELPRELAERLGSAWRTNLLRTQHRSGPPRIVLDAPTYTVHRSGTFERGLCGQVTAPEPESIPGQMVRVGELLREYARSSESRPEQLRRISVELKNM